MATISNLYVDAGDLRFNSSTNQYEGYNGTAWGSIGGGATGGAVMLRTSNNLNGYLDISAEF